MEREIVCRNCRSPAYPTVFDGEDGFSYYCAHCEQIVRVAEIDSSDTNNDRRTTLLRAMAYKAVEEAWRRGKVGRAEAYRLAFAPVPRVGIGDFYLLDRAEARSVAFAAARIGMEGVDWDELREGEHTVVHQAVQNGSQRHITDAARHRKGHGNVIYFGSPLPPNNDVQGRVDLQGASGRQEIRDRDSAQRMENER